MIDARQILSTRAFYWLPIKAGQNICLTHIVKNNANFMNRTGLSIQRFSASNRDTTLCNSFVESFFNARNLQSTMTCFFAKSAN